MKVNSRSDPAPQAWILLLIILCCKLGRGNGAGVAVNVDCVYDEVSCDIFVILVNLEASLKLFKSYIGQGEMSICSDVLVQTISKGKSGRSLA
jgi:hypothetical protein